MTVPRRSAAEVWLLLDVVALVLAVVALLDLALPWWSYLGGHEESHTSSGWELLGSSEYGAGWLVLLAVAVTVLATVLRRWWLSVVAAVVSTAALFFLVVGAVSAQKAAVHDEHAHAGLWVGVALITMCGAQQVALATLARRAN